MKELSRLSRVPLATEDDVREEFVTPLLRLLGYDHSRGEIQRGKKLATPYRSGTKRKEYVIPDYVIQLRTSIGIAVDAKSPTSAEDYARHIVLDQKHVSQVHSYAAHREVQAPFFVVTNGQCTAVFETARTTFEPVLVVAQSELTSRFSALQALLGKPALSQLLAAQLPLAWTVSLRHRDVGFQPINLDIGDVDQDGLPEIAIALSENRIPLVSSRGEELVSVQTDGWVWWVKCTGATDPDEATLVALQHARGPLDPTGKLLGINGSRVIWEHPLTRAGSGFEELDRIVVDRDERTVIFAVPCDNVIRCVSFAGDTRWETRIPDEGSWTSTMHVLRISPDQVLATVGGRTTGVLAEIDTHSGAPRAVIELPFRGAQIVSLDSGNHRLVISNADGADIAIVDRDSGEVSAVAIPASPINNRRLAVSLPLKLLVITGASYISCYSLDAVGIGLPEPLWTTDRVRGYINRLLWVDTTHGPRLLLSTCGTMVAPHYNGVYLVTPDGAVEHKYLVTSEATGMFGITGVRDVKAAVLSRVGAVDILAIADDSRLYLWHPP